MNYTVTVSNQAQRDLGKLPAHILDAIEPMLNGLGDNPRPAGCKKLKGTEHTWRTRSRDYRILYEIDDSTKTVTIIKVGHRKEIYRR